MNTLKQPLTTDPKALSYIGIIIRTFEPLLFMIISKNENQKT